MAGAATAAKRKATQARAAEPALLEKIAVISNESSDTVSLLQGTVRVLYWESILSDSISAEVVFTDAGNTLKTTKNTRRGRRPTRKKVSAVEGLPIVGEEKVNLKFTDNSENTLNFSDSDNNNLYVNKITALPTDSQTTTKSYTLNLTSKEFIDNEKLRVRVCRSGEVSDHAKFILEDVFETEKTIDLDDTNSPLDYSGLNKKPFYALNKLSTKAISSENQDATETGGSAGYFFWETSIGYNFKSIDTLLSQEPKKKILYNETPDSAGKGIPPQYDLKALTLDVDNRINVQKKLQMGAYNTRRIVFDPFNTYYESNTLDAFNMQEDLKLAGERLPVPNQEFTKEGSDKDFSRTLYLLASTGQRNIGPIEDQLNKSKDENFKAKLIANQSVMRYNQLFASQIIITIPGEFSLHAGDAIFLDIPQISDTENKVCNDEVNQEDSGLYIIADLCHYITSKDTYTKLNLIRDSFGRKGSASTDSIINSSP